MRVVYTLGDKQFLLADYETQITSTIGQGREDTMTWSGSGQLGVSPYK